MREENLVQGDLPEKRIHATVLVPTLPCVRDSAVPSATTGSAMRFRRTRTPPPADSSAERPALPWTLQRRGAVRNIFSVAGTAPLTVAEMDVSPTVARRVLSARTTRALACEVETCPICLEGYMPGDEVACMPCLHKLHWRCLYVWLERANTCPTCRWSLSSEGTDACSLGSSLDEASAEEVSSLVSLSRSRGESELERLRQSGSTSGRSSPDPR